MRGSPQPAIPPLLRALATEYSSLLHPRRLSPQPRRPPRRPNGYHQSSLGRLTGSIADPSFPLPPVGLKLSYGLPAVIDAHWSWTPPHKSVLWRGVELAGLSLTPAWPAGDHGVHIYLSPQAYQTFCWSNLSNCSTADLFFKIQCLAATLHLQSREAARYRPLQPAL